MLGEGALGEVEGGGRAEVLAELAKLLSGEVFVGKVGVQRARKDADGNEIYGARNRITYFYPASEWEGEAEGY